MKYELAAIVAAIVFHALNASAMQMRDRLSGLGYAALAGFALVLAGLAVGRGLVS